MIAALAMVALIGCIAWAGAAGGLAFLFSVVLPYVAVIIFVVGVIRRMVYWAKSPVPFRIPTTGGQEASLDFIKQEKWDCPCTTGQTVVRMLLEVLTFRSLFRNTHAEVLLNDPVNKGPRVVYYSSKWLWVFALLFHYCFLVVIIRHFRFFLDPVPACITWVETFDGLMQVGVPRFYVTGGLLLVALIFLLTRRLVNERVRYISLLNDYFPLLLLIGIVATGLCMRYFDKADIASIKVFIMGLVHLSPVSAAGLPSLFVVHLTFVCVLLLYFPFSKLMHMPGIFFSPTRNVPNDTRRVRHVNPWNPPKQFFTYAEYEDEYREFMAEAGLPLEKQPEKAAE